MKKEDLINKGPAAAITLAFMTFVRPDAEPTRLGTTIVALLMYESLRWCIWYIRKINRKKKAERYITVTKQDIRRWSEEWFNPFTEVS